LNVHAGRASQLSNLHSEIIHPILGYKARQITTAATIPEAWCSAPAAGSATSGSEIGPIVAKRMSKRPKGTVVKSDRRGRIPSQLPTGVRTISTEHLA
jgi:hypothetical protein